MCIHYLSAVTNASHQSEYSFCQLSFVRCNGNPGGTVTTLRLHEKLYDLILLCLLLMFIFLFLNLTYLSVFALSSTSLLSTASSVFVVSFIFSTYLSLISIFIFFFSCSFLTFSPSPPLPCSHQREYLSEISSWKYPAQTDRSTSPPLRLSSPSPLQQPDRTTKGPECTRLASEMATEWRWQRSTFPFPLWFPRGRSSSRRVKIDRKRLAGCYRKRVSFSRGRIAGLS